MNHKQRRIKYSALIIIFLICLILTGCKEQIVHNLSEGDVNNILTRLHRVNVIGEKKLQPDGKWALAVSRRDAIKALSELSRARIFKSTKNTKNYSSKGMIPSRDTQRFEYQRAVGHEVEMTLEALSGVLEARVHVNIPLGDPLLRARKGDQARSSASVLLITDNTYQTRNSDISMLVGGAIGIDPKAIAVLITNHDTRDTPQEKTTTKLETPLHVPRVAKTQSPTGEVLPPLDIHPPLLYPPTALDAPLESGLEMNVKKEMEVEEKNRELAPLNSAKNQEGALNQEGTFLGKYWQLLCSFILFLIGLICIFCSLFWLRKEPQDLGRNTFSTQLESL